MKSWNVREAANEIEARLQGIGIGASFKRTLAFQSSPSTLQPLEAIAEYTKVVDAVGQRVVDLMGNACGELAQTRHFFKLKEALAIAVDRLRRIIRSFFLRTYHPRRHSRGTASLEA